MEQRYMRFGDFIRERRLNDSRELTVMDVASHLGVSRSYLSEVENNRKRPLDYKKLQQLAEFLRMTENDTAVMYDLASQDNGAVPYDIADTFMYGEVGKFARVALRRSKAGFITEDDWKTFIRQAEERQKIHHSE